MIASTQTNHPLAGVSGQGKPSSPLDVACERLRAAGLRITQPRVAIINALLGRSTPVSIEQLHSQLDQSTCDLVTVYRCLSAFQKAGLVRLSYFHNGTSLYQLALDEAEATFHVVDRSSQASETLDPALSEELRQVVRRIETDLKNKGYTAVRAVVNFVADKPTPELREISPAATPLSRSESPSLTTF